MSLTTHTFSTVWNWSTEILSIIPTLDRWITEFQWWKSTWQVLNWRLKSSLLECRNIKIHIAFLQRSSQWHGCQLRRSISWKSVSSIDHLTFEPVSIFQWIINGLQSTHFALNPDLYFHSRKSIPKIMNQNNFILFQNIRTLVFTLKKQREKFQMS